MRNKRFLAAALSAVVTLGCVSAFTACKEETPPTVPPEVDDGTGDGTELVLVAPAIRLKSGVLKWQAVENAESYSVYYSSGGREHVASERQTELTYTPKHEDIGEYDYWVVAVNSSKNKVSGKSNTVKIKITAPVIEKPVLTFDGDILKWEAVPNASGYEVKDCNGKTVELTGTSFDISNGKPAQTGTYYYFVTAKTGSPNYTDSVAAAIAYTVNDPKLSSASTPLTNSTVFIVGDSTACSFTDSYYLPGYGYGTQLEEFLDLGAGASVNNLAMSGRSSYSFTTEANYKTLKAEIKAGDYLLIGFGHNDEKGEDGRYTNPNLTVDDNTQLAGRPVSFKNVLYNYYVKIAEEARATPVLCTPIVRVSDKNDYSGSNGHITGSNGNYAGGDYAKAVRELGEEKGVKVIDLTAITKADYEAVGYENACDYHAFTSTKQGVRAGLDGTHTNMYGAKTNAYYIAAELKKSDCALGAHVKADISRPTYAVDYQKAVNSTYTEPEYKPFDPAQKSGIWTGVTAKDWYGTVFGDIGSTNNLNAQNFTITHGADEKSFKVSSHFADKGKIASSDDGLVAAFMQIDCEMNFEFTAKVTVDSFTSVPPHN